MQYIQYYDSPLGRITLASDGEKLSGLWFENQKYYGSTLSEERELKKLPVFDQTGQWLGLYFRGQEPDFIPPLSMEGTPFRKSVWEIMLRIPYGQTMAYGAIAKEIAAQRGIGQMSAHAVGSAVSHNPISIIIPCHRVVGTNGSLTGYAGGVEKKRLLLALEQADLSKLFVPTKGTAL